jgi:hypothetical protein
MSHVAAATASVRDAAGDGLRVRYRCSRALPWWWFF